MSRIFYEETHNKLRKLFTTIKRTETGGGEMKLEGGSSSNFEKYKEKYNFVNNPFIRKYSNFGKFSSEMAKHVEAQLENFRREELEDDGMQEFVYKSMTDLWRLLAEVFSFKLSEQEVNPESFEATFTQFYNRNNSEIYYQNQEEKIENFISSSYEKIKNLPKMSSLEIIDKIISSDPFLLKMNSILEWLKTTLELNETELKRTKTQIAEQGLRYDINSEHLKNSLIKKFYKGILRLVKIKGIEAADNVVKDVFGEDCPLSGIINGGLPFIDGDLYQKISKYEKKMRKVKKIKNFKILDFMENSDFKVFIEPSELYPEEGEDGVRKNCVGNSNWLVWQRCLYLGLNASRHAEERRLFGFLCSDFTESTSGCDSDMEYGFDERFYELFRCYFNNEVMRRYIVFRKILQSEDKISLFNESSELEEKFQSLTPSEILDYLYPESKSHTLYIEKTNFVKKISELLLDKNNQFNSIHLLILLNFLASGERDIEIDKLYSKEEIKKSLKNLKNELEDENLKKFFFNQYTILSTLVVSSSLKNNKLEFFDFCEDFSEIFLSFVGDYVDLLTHDNHTYDIPFIYGLFLELNSEKIFSKICEFLSKIHDKNTMKILKEEVKKNFPQSSEIFVEVTKISSLKNPKNPSLDLQNTITDSILEDFSGIEWVLDDEKNFPEGIKICLGIFRKFLLKKNWKKASEFNQIYLNKLITSNASFIRSLQDDNEDRNLKTFLREKSLLTKILDCVAFSKNFTSKKILVSSSRIGESRLNIYGVDEFDHNRRKHDEVFQKLMECLFVKDGFWIFDFIEFIEDGDGERARELKMLRIVMIGVVFDALVGMLEVCKDAKQQYIQIVGLLKKLRAAREDILRSNREIVNEVMSKITNLLARNPMTLLPLVKNN